MTVEEAIKKAIEGGHYGGWGAKMSGGKPHWDFELVDVPFLDPDFWKALGKSLRWRNHILQKNPCEIKVYAWQLEWQRFISYLAHGKTAEKFFADLD